MKKYLIIGGLVAGAGYLYLKNRKTAAVAVPKNGAAKNAGNAGTVYPFKGAVAPRVDNQSQPWYNQALSAIGFGTKNDSSNMQTSALSLGAGSSIVHSLSNIWGDGSGIFSSNEPTGGSVSTGSADEISVVDTPLEIGSNDTGIVSDSADSEFADSSGDFGDISTYSA